jgi:hypothetical protein
VVAQPVAQPAAEVLAVRSLPRTGSGGTQEAVYGPIAMLVVIGGVAGSFLGLLRHLRKLEGRR